MYCKLVHTRFALFWVVDTELHTSLSHVVFSNVPFDKVGFHYVVYSYLAYTKALNSDLVLSDVASAHEGTEKPGSIWIPGDKVVVLTQPGGGVEQPAELVVIGRGEAAQFPSCKVDD